MPLFDVVCCCVMVVVCVTWLSLISVARCCRQLSVIAPWCLLVFDVAYYCVLVVVSICCSRCSTAVAWQSSNIGIVNIPSQSLS